ncbi:hypothetical protein VTN96DRAFT_3862 [Rasamsonia emersonii]
MNDQSLVINVCQVQGSNVYTPLITVVRSLLSLSALRACDSLLQSSNPLQLWDSSMRCFWQKWPLQKLQSPMMRWAKSLQSLKLQRGLRGGMLVDSGERYVEASRTEDRERTVECVGWCSDHALIDCLVVEGCLELAGRSHAVAEVDRCPITAEITGGEEESRRIGDGS